MRVKHTHFTWKKVKKCPKSDLGLYRFSVIYALVYSYIAVGN